MNQNRINDIFNKKENNQENRVDFIPMNDMEVNAYKSLVQRLRNTQCELDSYVSALARNCGIFNAKGQWKSVYDENGDIIGIRRIDAT